MAVPPPPPPPGPPPPPMLNLNVGGGNNSGQARNALLQSIQKGTKLKPTQTVDKSKPILQGGIRTSPGGDDQQQATTPSKATPSTTNNGGPVLDFQTELMNKLNRKGNATATTVSPVAQQAQQKATPPVPAQPPINRNNINRGPPPQPPKQNETSKSSTTTVFANSSNGKPANMPSIVIPNSNNTSGNNGIPVLPNKSTLFPSSSSTTTTPTLQSPQPQSPQFGNHHHPHQSSSSSSSPIPAKPVINHGKPNLAPKPPGMVLPSSGGTTPPARPTVARHQSMRSPRSPPIAMSSDGPVFPSKINNFGTIRVRNNFASTDEINKPSLIGRPNEPPPKPPQFNRPPPPVPTKSHSNNDISITDALASGQPAISSAKSEVTLHSGLSIPKQPPKVSTVNSEVDAPPLPPHRVAPKPHAAPAVPRRTTSMQTQNSNASSNTNTVARRVIDLEMKFANYFHKTNEFPAPPPFTATTKTYPSQSSKNVARG